MIKTGVRDYYYDFPVAQWTLDEHRYQQLVDAHAWVDHVRVNYKRDNLSSVDVKMLAIAIASLSEVLGQVSDNLWLGDKK